MALFSTIAFGGQVLRAAAPEGTTLRKEWKRYEALARQDLPEDEMAALEAIMSKAGQKRLPLDFYEAAKRYRDRRISRSWKERDAAGKEFRERILSFGMPALTAYCYSMEDVARLADFVAGHADELRNMVTPSLYSRRPLSYAAAFVTFRNDLEYAAWLALDGSHDDRVLSILEKDYCGRYPESALLEYCKEASKWSVKPQMEAFADKHKGQGVALLAENWLLREKVNELTSSDTATCASLLSLRDECEDFHARIKEMSRKEKWLGRGRLTAAKDGLDILTARSVTARIENNVVKSTFVNVPCAELTLTEGKKSVYKAKLVNPVCSFFKPDTLSLALPDIEDGKFLLRIKAKGTETVGINYDKASLSVAVRRHDEKLWLYVADFMTGRPVDKIDLTVRKDGSNGVLAEVRDIELDGFTAFPESLASAMKEKEQYSLTCSYRDEAGRLHKSRELMLDKRGVIVYASDVSEVTQAQVLMGCGAYHPGDTVRFKVIAYRGDIYSSLRTFEEGEELGVNVSGPQEYRSEMKLRTNEFGSAEGVFALPEDAEGGVYLITVSGVKKNMGSVGFRVDEYVLPTFAIHFDEDERFWFRGDSVTVKGTVVAYSGHALTSANLTYVCEGCSGKAEIAPDGSFSFAFVPEYSYSGCTVKVVDATGETCEAHRYVNLCDDRGGTAFYLEGPKTDGHDQVAAESYSLVSDPRAEFRFRWTKESLNGVLPSKVSYRVMHDDSLVSEGEVGMGDSFRLSFTGKSCLYEIKAVTVVDDLGGAAHSDEETFRVLYVSDDADVIDAPVENLLKFCDGGDVVAQFGAGLGDVWAIAELWGCDHRLLHEEMIHLTGGRGAEGSLRRICWKYQEDWPEVVQLKIFYFRNAREYRLGHTYTRPRGRLKMPVGFSRFADKTLPGNSYKFAVRAAPQSECLVAVYDVSADKIWPNHWDSVALRLKPSYSGMTNDVCGSFDSEKPARIMYKTAANVRIRGIADAGVYAYAEEAEAVPSMLASSASDVAVVGYRDPEMDAVDVRSEYEDVLAFEPFLRTGADGEVRFNVKTSDKLSTYHVAVYAHDKDMHNGTITRDMTVTVPVKVSLVQPRILYEGDRYVLHATVSNSSAEDIDGIFGIDIYDGETWKDAPVLSHTEGKAHVPASGSAQLSFPVGKVPHCGSGVLGLKVVFASRNAEDMKVSDGMFVTVPVEAPEQVITEAHSALVKSDGDRKRLTDSLMAQFANGSAASTLAEEILISDQLREVLDQSSVTDAEDAVSLSSAMVFRMLADHLNGKGADAGRYAAALLNLQGPDGGFAWLSGMGSSVHVTALVLERLARLKSLGIMPPDFNEQVISSAVRYLDSRYFADGDADVWRPALSEGQYFYVRSLYPEIPLEEKLTSKMKAGDRDYLTPAKNHAALCVFHKARRIRTIANLQSSEAGVALARAWGVKLMTSSRLDKTLERDLASLMQYAVAHPSGGMFYPNAVMPWRGLMESELYAHSFLCDLFHDIAKAYPEHAVRASEISEGIRLWIMVQKETQKWEADPAFAEAAASVMDGSQALMDTRVLVLERSFKTPFSQVRKAGNGMALSTAYSIRRGDKWVELKDGDVLPVGETVRATYTLWSEENRSFVRMSVPRPGCLVPVIQTSGYCRWGCYRRVRSAATEYYWEMFPEEKTVVTEEFHVSQEGTFAVPAAEVMSAYAPHYRANTSATLPIRTEFLN